MRRIKKKNLMVTYRKKRQSAAAEKTTKKIVINKIEEKAAVDKSEQPPVKKPSAVKTKAAAIAASGFKKVYAEDTCRVTFTLPKEAAPNASTVAIAGDFNSWNTTSDMMRQSRNGNFTITLTLAADRDYQFKYIIDGTRWENDWKADRYEGENSVVAV
ncbi:MAG: isoamylase early set domain-containing protein [Candidatus Magnetominusculus sp. LBB02]|nr:isoamylase early set domain-containing protein [Candidatus Magnetominusculus sp. LBB02]